MNQTPSWKKGVIILLLAEIFLFTVGVLIHECTHNLSFFVLSGQFGEMHVFDAVALRARTVGICFPPQGLVIKDVLPFELVAYGMMFLLTGVFAFIFIRLFYSDFNLKKFSTLSQ